MTMMDLKDVHVNAAKSREKLAQRVGTVARADGVALHPPEGTRSRDQRPDLDLGVANERE